MKAPLPADETDRLCSVHGLGVLDTPAEPGFDDIAELAAALCATPTAVVTLIDRERQWFKAAHGLDVRETHRDLSFCAYTILGRDGLVVPDARQDRRFADNGLVIGPPHIRFYAGVPLLNDTGHALGALAVIDYQPRELDPAKLRLLRLLARQVLDQLELRRHLQQGQDERQQFEEEAARIFNLSHDLICTMDGQCRLRRVNPAFIRLLGFDAAALQGRPLSELVHVEDRERCAELLRGALAGKAVPMFETRLMAAGGRTVCVEVAVTLERRNGQLTGITAIARDRTERRELQQQLLQAQRMEAIGQLAGGVAHDFNNILAAILLQSSLLRLSDELSGEMRDGLHQIEAAAERGAGLTRQLLAFSRRQQMQLENVVLGDVVERLGKMLRRIVGEDIRLEFDLAPHLPCVRADPGMLEQVIMNLVVNARDAMPDGGKLLIGTAARTEADAEGVPRVWAMLMVSDTGHGIPPDILPRIYDPFFTTKDVGKGTGLGLATVYGIVHEHGGTIAVRTEVGRGTTFELSLPTVRADKTLPAPPASKEPGGSETILLAEDEEAVRMLLRSALERKGYRVFEAESGRAALALWQEHRQQIDLLLTDIIMPEDMSGPELATALQAERPELRVIYMSGYSGRVHPKGLRLKEGENYLQKPFGPAALLRTVRQVCDSPGRPAS